MTENEAVLKCQNGDRDAFRYLVEQYKNVLYGTAYLMTSNRALAEEQSKRHSYWRGGGSGASNEGAPSSRGSCESW